MNTPQIITCAEAKARGLKRYFTGKPCSRGHVLERYMSCKACVECNKARYKPRIMSKNCIMCGEAFEGKSNSKLCSTCRRESLREYKRKWGREDYRKKRASNIRFKACVICGKKFPSMRSTKTCSPEHGRQLALETKRLWVLRNPERAKEISNRGCRRWNMKNRGRRRDSKRQWIARNPDKVKKQQENRRKRKNEIAAVYLAVKAAGLLDGLTMGEAK